MQQLADSTRSCGSCRACCKPWTVAEVGKYDSDWCPKSTPCNGCSIYKTRPAECKRFACLWLNGRGEDSDRPDILGVMMDAQDFAIGERAIAIFHLWEIEPRALEKPRIQAIIEANKDAGNIVILHRPIGITGYTREPILPQEHFSKREIREFGQIYDRWMRSLPPTT